MAIRVLCACGKSMTVKDEHAGKKAKCPTCGRLMPIPDAPAAANPAPPAQMRSAQPRSNPQPSAAPSDPGSDMDLLSESPVGDAPRCPMCQDVFPSGTDTCARCNIDLHTGRIADAGLPSAPGSAGPGRRSERVIRTQVEEPAELGFGALMLFTLIAPGRTMENILHHLGRPDMLIKMTCLYMCSLIVVALVAGFGAGARMGDPGGAPTPTVPADDIPVYAQASGVELGRLTFDLTADPHPPKPNAPFTLHYKVWLKEDGKPWTKKLTAFIVYEADREDDGDVLWDGDILPSSPGEYPCTIEVGAPGNYLVQLVFEQAQDLPDIHFTHRFTVPATVAESVSRVARRAPLALTLAIAAILHALVMLVIDTAILNVGARLLGGGGGFLPMLATMGFLCGMVNLARLLTVGVSIVSPGELSTWLEWGFALWNLVLYYLALMKVYDLDLMGAFIASAVAGVIRMWLGAMMLIGIAGVVARLIG